jgi:hypothetical protein
MGEMRNECKILVGKPKGKRPLKRPRSRWDDNIRMDFMETVFESVDWILAVSCEHGNELSGTIKGGESLE